MGQPTTSQNSLAGNIVSHSSGNSVSTLTKSKASMPASSAMQSWPGNYQSCKRSYQSALSSRRNKGKSYFQPYKIKETWTHDFCVVDKRDQRKVPSTTHKQELREAGLGQKTVIFKNKRGEFRHIQEELFNRYAKLQQAGGFDLYRQGSGKDLIYIKPPPTGYTIPFLKNDYGIKSAIIYVLPIQRDLTMDPEVVENLLVGIITRWFYQGGVNSSFNTQGIISHFGTVYIFTCLCVDNHAIF